MSACLPENFLSALIYLNGKKVIIAQENKKPQGNKMICLVLS